MSRPGNALKSDQDEQLADFTDRVMAGQAQQSASNMNEELLLLEETVLRLKTTYPPVVLNETRIKQMHIRLKNRLKRNAREVKQPFWKKWLSLPNISGVLVSAFSILLIFILSPYFTAIGSFTAATALSPIKGTFAVLGLTITVVLLFFLVRHRK